MVITKNPKVENQSISLAMFCYCSADMILALILDSVVRILILSNYQ